jgi:hypothetical protein
LTPYVARMVAEAGPRRALPFYLVALASVFAALALMRLWATLRPALLHAGVERRKWRDEMFYQAAAGLGLAALGGWAIVNHRAIGSEAMLVLALGLGATRQLVRRRRTA